MTPEERQKLEQEWATIQQKINGANLVDPKDIRRMDQITSLLVTDGATDSVKFNFVKGKGGRKGMNITKPYNRKGKVG